MAVDLAEFEDLMRGMGPRCSVKVLLADVDAATRATLEAALAADRITGSAIAKWCHARGLRITGPSIQRHRRGDCSCERT